MITNQGFSVVFLMMQKTISCLTDFFSQFKWSYIVKRSVFFIILLV